ncbi:unnamed protein product, partial [Polarella glacialis]
MILYAYCQKAGVESILQGQLPPMMPATKKEPAEFADLAAIADNFGISVATKAAASNSEYCVALRVPAELATQAETPGRDLWIVRFDQDKVSPLLQAAKEGDAAKVRKGLGDGASGDVVDEEGISALMMAAMAGSADSCQALLENSTNRTASVNYAEPMSSRTALMFAAQGGHAEAVKVLAAASADVSKVDKEGTTALMWAAVAGKAETAKLLAAQGHKDLKNAQVVRSPFMESFKSLVQSTVRHLLLTSRPLRCYEDSGLSVFPSPTRASPQEWPEAIKIVTLSVRPLPSLINMANEGGDVPMGDAAAAAPAAAVATQKPAEGLDSADIWGEDNILTDELKRAGADEINQRIRLLENDIRIMKSEQQRLHHEMKTIEEKTKDNKEKIKLNRQLPHLVANVSEILDLPHDEDEEDGGMVDVDSARDGKSIVVKTTTRQTIFLPVIGLVEAEDLQPNDLVGVNKDSYLVLDKLPAEYDSRVKAME